MFARTLESLFQAVKRAQRRWHAPDVREAKAHPPLVPPIDLSRIRNVLIYKPDDIGDAVFALPAISEMRRVLPKARLSLICQKKTSAVYERAGLFDEISEVQIKTRLLRFRSFDVNEALAKLSEQSFDLAIYLRTYSSLFWTFRKIEARIKVHPWNPLMRSSSTHQPWVEEREHQALQMLRIVECLTGKKYTQSDIRYPAFHWRDEDAFEIPDKDYFVAHPFAPIETRRYPQAHWIKVLEGLSKQHPIYVIGAPTDGEWEETSRVRSLVGKLSVGQLGKLIAGAKGFIGNESGPLHWAGALGIPAVALFGGHSAISEWGPLGNTKILTSPVDCSPCHRRYCPGFGVKCLTELKPEEVLRQSSSFF